MTSEEQVAFDRGVRAERFRWAKWIVRAFHIANKQLGYAQEEEKERLSKGEAFERVRVDLSWKIYGHMAEKLILRIIVGHLLRIKDSRNGKIYFRGEQHR